MFPDMLSCYMIVNSLRSYLDQIYPVLSNNISFRQKAFSLFRKIGLDPHTLLDLVKSSPPTWKSSLLPREILFPSRGNPRVGALELGPLCKSVESIRVPAKLTSSTNPPKLGVLLKGNRSIERFSLYQTKTNFTYIQSGASSRAKNGDAYFSDVTGSNQDPIAVPGPCEVTEYQILMAVFTTGNFYFAPHSHIASAAPWAFQMGLCLSWPH